VLGNLPIYNAHRKHDWIMEQHELLGDTFEVFFPTQIPIRATCNLENIEHVLRKNFKVWDKGEIFHANISQLLGETGIFCSGMKGRI
jgi:hypothetical protein